uniref:ThiamineS protein n=1 Tax=Caulobacter sp. (strain K31) TaxID=366602 RepID=B0SV90_CAUSK
MTQGLALAPEAMGSVQVRFFGKIADRFGRTAIVDIPASGCSLAWLRTELADQVEGGTEALAEPGLRVAIDHLIAGDEAWVAAGQDVAFLSMFSGG